MANEDRISPKRKSGLSILAKLDEDIFRKFYENLIALPFMMHPKTMADTISNNVKSLSSSNIESILTTLVGLVASREGESLTSERVIADVIDTLREEGIDGVEINSEFEKTISRRLLKLAETEQIFYSFQALDLNTEHENIFIGAQINVEMRPIFNKGSNELPKAVLICNLFHIHYHQSGEHRDIYLALEKEDLETLKIEIEKSQNQILQLEKLIVKQNLINIGNGTRQE
jgi:hypothetical protein